MSHVNRFTRNARVSGGAAIVVGLLVILGWVLEIDLLKRLLAGKIAMKPNTAICFVLIGAALLLLASPRQSIASALRRRAARVCAAVVAVISLASLCEILIGVDLRLDRLLFRNLLLSEADPGRMAATSALSFIFLCVTLLLVDAKNKIARVTVDLLALATLFFGATALLGYLYQVEWSFHLVPFTPMALHTAFLFVVLALGVLLSRPERGMMSVLTSDHGGGVMARHLLAVAVLLPIVLGLLWLKADQLGLLGNRLGLALFVVTNIILLGVSVWLAARSLNLFDARREQAQESLQASELRYRRLFESAKDGILILDADSGQIVDVNPFLAEMLDYSEEELLGKELWQIGVFKDVAASKAAFVELQEKGYIRYDDLPLKTRGGVVKQLEFVSNSYLVNGSRVIQCNIRDITERKRTEEALRTSQQIIGGILDAIPVRIFWKDKNLVYLGCNATFANDAGFADPKDIIGKDDYQLAWRDQAELYRADDRQVIEDGSTRLLFEEPLTTPEGNIRTLLTSKVPLRSSTGEITGVLGTFMDITERKRLEEQRELLSTLVQASPDFIGYADPKTSQILYINKHGRRMCGIGDDEELDLKISDVHPDWMSRRMEEVILPAAVRDGAWEGDGAFLHRNGSEIPVSMLLLARKNANGEVDLFYTVSRDIAERKRAEEGLRESEATFKDLFDDAPVAYHEIDNEGRFTRVNLTEQQLLGYTAEEMQGRFAWEFIVEKVSRDAVEKKLSGKGSLQAFERTFIRKDGTFVPMEIQDRLLYDSDGKICGIRSTLHNITERKRAAEALRQSEERYRDLVENAHDIIYSHDLEGNYTSVNEAGELITGYSREEALKLNLLEMVAPEHVAKARDMFRRKLAGESTTAYEIEIVAKDGRRVPLEVSTRLMLENGVPIGVTGIARDITERKKAEAELRFQQSLLESQMESSIDGVLVVSPAGEVLSFNRRFLQLWGIAEEILGKSDREALGSALDLVKSPQQFIERVQYLYEHPDERSEEEIELRDGRTFERHSAPVHGPQSEHYGRVWFFRDITERKLAQAELTRLATAVNQTADSIVITDTAGNIEYVNPAFELVTGYTKEEAVGKNPRMLKSSANPPSVYEDLWETITRGDVWIGQLINKRKDGSLFNERATISAVRDDAGKIAHFIAVKKDMTHEHNLEDQLRQSQKMEAIGQLAGGVAHDFNNLLTAISGYTSLAIQRVDEHNPIKPYLEEVKKAGDRAANLTRQLLAFGRKQILQPVPLDLNSIVSDMNKMLRRLIGEDINLTAKLAGDLKRIQADPGQIEQVLVNLVVNARDAMPQGGSLTIETANVELDREYARGHVDTQPGNYVMLAVSDTGTGMSEETRMRIFEPFFTTKEKGKGTGLGLSTVYGIVQQSGGSIWVYSELDHGTSFKVYLPQLDVPVKAPTETIFVEDVPRGSETILLVEDEEVVRGLATHILEDAGYKVLKARGGSEAIQLCTAGTQQIDLLLTDVVMPETSGKEVAERVTALMPHLKVLFMSGYTDEAIVHHGVLDSNVEFIQKPFTPFGLSKKVREVLDSNGHEHRG